jgi:hypothetical protein
MLKAPYAAHKIHRTTPGEDDVFTDQQGNLSIATLHWRNPSTPQASLYAELITTVDSTATPGPAGRRHGGPPPHA